MNGDEAGRARLAEGDFTDRPREGSGESLRDFLADPPLSALKGGFVGIIEEMHLSPGGADGDDSTAGLGVG
jgi:hypothetical protein